jgi:hypothetical protein
VGLHASKLEEAIAVERYGISIPIQGSLSSGQSYETVILIPQAFTYLLMKLCAYRDRMNDADKGSGRHHAIDIYRIVGLLTRAEDADVQTLSAEYAGHPTVIDARQIAATHFNSSDDIGCVRIQEHPLYTPALNLNLFCKELKHLLAGSK